MTPEEAAKRTAALFYADLDVEIDPNALMAFIKRRWARIAPMAHIMHEAPDFTKYSLVADVSTATRAKDTEPASADVYLSPTQDLIHERILRALDHQVSADVRIRIARILAGTNI